MAFPPRQPRPRPQRPRRRARRRARRVQAPRHRRGHRRGRDRPVAVDEGATVEEHQLGRGHDRRPSSRCWRPPAATREAARRRGATVPVGDVISTCRPRRRRGSAAAPVRPQRLRLLLGVGPARRPPPAGPREPRRRQGARVRARAAWRESSAWISWPAAAPAAARSVVRTSRPSRSSGWPLPGAVTAGCARRRRPSPRPGPRAAPGPPCGRPAALAALIPTLHRRSARPTAASAARSATR